MAGIVWGGSLRSPAIVSVLGVYNLRVYGVFSGKNQIKGLFQLGHHAIDQVLVAGSLGVSVSVHKLSEGAFVHRWGLRR